MNGNDSNPHGKAGGLSGRVAAITGAAGALGSAFARHLGGMGARLVLLDLKLEALAPVEAQLRAAGMDAISVVCDVTNEESVTRAAKEVVARLGRCDVLVNNAGILAAAGPLASLSLEDWNRSLAVNLTGVMLCTREFGKPMIRMGSGSIVNIASVSAHSPNAAPPYSVTKAAVLALTRHTAVEWGPMGVRTNSVSPGFLITPLSAQVYADPDMAQLRTQSTPQRRLGTVDDIAQVVAFLASDAAAFVNGEDIVADGGFLRTSLMHMQSYSAQYGGTHQADLSAFARIGKHAKAVA